MATDVANEVPSSFTSGRVLGFAEMVHALMLWHWHFQRSFWLFGPHIFQMDSEARAAQRNYNTGCAVNREIVKSRSARSRSISARSRSIFVLKASKLCSAKKS